MLFPRKSKQFRTSKYAKRFPASPKALGLATFSLVGLCFGSAVYLAAMPGLIAQSPAVSVASEAGEKVADEASEAFEGAKETVKKSLSSAFLPAANAKEADSPAVEQPQQSEQKKEALKPAADSASTDSNTPAKDDTSDVIPDKPSDSGLDAATEAKWYNYYASSYNDLSTMLESYNACVADFDNLKYAPQQERQAAASRCEALSSELLAGYLRVRDSGIPDASKYHSVQVAQISCYRCLSGALGSIIDAWKVNLSFADPSGHEAEFMQPIMKDQVDHENKYLAEFSTNYPSGCPDAQ